MEFPQRIYTIEEFMEAKELVEKGYKHKLVIIGSRDFKEMVERILKLIHIASCYDFLRTYIRCIKEIEGISQLRETEATVWLNDYMVENPVEGSRFIIQKVYEMKSYLEGREYYEKGEREAVGRSVEFLRALKNRSISEELVLMCEEVLKKWTEDTVL